MADCGRRILLLLALQSSSALAVVDLLLGLLGNLTHHLDRLDRIAAGSGFTR